MGFRTTSWVLLVAVTLIAAAGANLLAQDADKGTLLLAEARRVLGGAEKLRAVTTLQAKGDFKRMFGQNTIEGQLEVILQIPDKLRRNEDLSPPGGGPVIIRTEVLNGADVWDENVGGGNFLFRRGGGPGGGGRGGAGDPRDPRAGGRGGTPPDAEQVRQAQLRARRADLARFMIAWLLSTDAPVAWIATAESPDGRADVLEITPADGVATRLFLDASTHMPLMMTWQGLAPQFALRRGGPGGGGEPGSQGDRPPAPPRPQSATLRMTLGEYKTVSGIKLPHLITRGINDDTNEEWTISSYRINSSLRADTFVKK